MVGGRTWYIKADRDWRDGPKLSTLLKRPGADHRTTTRRQNPPGRSTFDRFSPWNRAIECKWYMGQFIRVTGGFEYWRCDLNCSFARWKDDCHRDQCQRRPGYFRASPER